MRFHVMSVALSAFLVAAATAACVGEIGNGGAASNADKSPTSGGGPSPQPTIATYPSATIRRLSNVELTNSVQDVFMGGATLTGTLLPMQRVRGGFDNQIAALDVTTPFMTTVQQVAEQASAYVAQNSSTLVGCDITQASCISQYLSKLARRAFRRPLTADETTEYTALYNARLAVDGASLALSAVVETLIQSPFFLYRTELGPETVASPTVTLTPFETAAALSYFVLSSAPDDILLDAAAANQLATADQRGAQARRLLQLPGAHDGAWNFLLQWAQVLDAQTLTGSFGTTYPAFTQDAATAALTETQTFFDQELFSGEANWKNLFTSTTSYLDSTLAAIYGVTLTGASSPSDFVAVQEDGTERAGFLTQASFLSSHSDGSGFSPVHFGLFVATQLFCKVIPPPPPNVPALPPDPGGTVSARQRFADHLSVPYCASCHAQFDPMGWGFEQYNPIGQYQTTSAGTPLTGAGSLVQTDVNGDFMGAPQLEAKIAQSKQAQACFTSKLYEYALGRTDADGSNVRSTAYDGSVAASAARFATDTNILNLMVSIAQSDAFVTRDATSLPLAGASK